MCLPAGKNSRLVTLQGLLGLRRLVGKKILDNLGKSNS